MKKKTKRYKNRAGTIKAGEPKAAYRAQGNLSTLFPALTVSTTGEQEEEMRKYSASLSPEQRMAYLQELIRIAYGDGLDDPDRKLWDNRIHIDRRK